MVTDLPVIPIGALGRQENFVYEPSDQAPKGGDTSFFRGHNCNFTPRKADYGSEGFLRKFVLKGWIPEAPLIGPQTKVTAFGSCFAEHITNHLGLRGYTLSKHLAPQIYISSMGEGMAHTHALLQQFEWALERVTPPVGLWHGYKAEEFGYDDGVREATQQVFLQTDLFIITLGLSEIWFDEPTGSIFWRAVPLKNYDPERHRFRVCSVEETKANLHRIRNLIAKHVPDAKIVFTLSPIPLMATFRDMSCMTATAASKAILRAALDEFYRENTDQLNKTLFYFPSYEIVNELFFDKFAESGRHPKEYIVGFIMRTFEAIYCAGDITLQHQDEMLNRIRAGNLDGVPLPPERGQVSGAPRTIKNLIRFLMRKPLFY